MCLFWTACASKYLTVCLKLKKYFEYKMYLYGNMLNYVFLTNDDTRIVYVWHMYNYQ